jgi:hypothetical protein
MTLASDLQKLPMLPKKLITEEYHDNSSKIGKASHFFRNRFLIYSVCGSLGCPGRAGDKSACQAGYKQACQYSVGSSNTLSR